LMPPAYLCRGLHKKGIPPSSSCPVTMDRHPWIGDHGPPDRCLPQSFHGGANDTYVMRYKPAFGGGGNGNESPAVLPMVRPG
jgi:hypothetical protein